MNWSEAEMEFRKEHGQKLSWETWMKWEYKQWGQEMSIPGLWSFRGKQWKKATGSYPKPEEVGLPADHHFFNPNVVCSSQYTYRNGTKDPVRYFHHGRLLKPGHRLYPENP